MFIGQLRDVALELKPLVGAATSNSLTWNGFKYVKGEEQKPDPYALAWWFTLISIADLIESQESPITNKQIDYFKRLLFGGMGSLNDLNFDSKKLGATADRINVGLKQKMQVLFASLNG